jgi:hypothetical protein
VAKGLGPLVYLDLEKKLKGPRVDDSACSTKFTAVLYPLSHPIAEYGVKSIYKPHNCQAVVWYSLMVEQGFQHSDGSAWFRQKKITRSLLRAAGDEASAAGGDNQKIGNIRRLYRTMICTYNAATQLGCPTLVRRGDRAFPPKMQL